MVRGYDPTLNDPSKIALQYLLRWSTDQTQKISLNDAEKYVKYWLKNSQQSTAKFYKYLCNKPKNKYNSQTSKQINSNQFKAPEIVIKKQCDKNAQSSNILSQTYTYSRIISSIKSGIYKQTEKIIKTVNQSKQDQKSNAKLQKSSIKKQYKYEQTQYDSKFPAYSQYHNNGQNKLTLCLDQISNKVQLKENLDRQLSILFQFRKRQQEKKQIQISNKKQLKSISDYIQSQKQKNRKQKQSLVQNKQQKANIELIQILYEGCKQGYKNYGLNKQATQKISKKCAKFLFFRRSGKELPWDLKIRYTSKLIDQLIL